MNKHNQKLAEIPKHVYWLLVMFIHYNGFYIFHCSQIGVVEEMQ